MNHDEFFECLDVVWNSVSINGRCPNTNSRSEESSSDTHDLTLKPYLNYASSGSMEQTAFDVHSSLRHNNAINMCFSGLPQSMDDITNSVLNNTSSGDIMLGERNQTKLTYIHIPSDCKMKLSSALSVDAPPHKTMMNPYWKELYDIQTSIISTECTVSIEKSKDNTIVIHGLPYVLNTSHFTTNDSGSDDKT